MATVDLARLIQRFLSETSIGPSALRGQGAPGVIKAARRFLVEMDLRRIPQGSKAQFDTWLNRRTGELVRRFPSKARNWGAARKAINLFLRDSYYNQFLSRAYGLDRVARYLEIPLDAITAKRLRSFDRSGVLPKWSGLKHLTESESNAFQAFALAQARRRQLERVHLDALLWPMGR